MNFEAVKVSMSQDKNGIILRLNVHPNDCPKELHTDWVGTRYVVAMVKLQDDDTPDDRGYVAIQRLIASAGLLSRNEDFFAFLVDYGMAEATARADEMETRAADAIRQVCGIQSRRSWPINARCRWRPFSMRSVRTAGEQPARRQASARRRCIDGCGCTLTSPRGTERRWGQRPRDSSALSMRSRPGRSTRPRRRSRCSSSG